MGSNEKDPTAEEIDKLVIEVIQERDAREARRKIELIPEARDIVEILEAIHNMDLLSVIATEEERYELWSKYNEFLDRVSPAVIQELINFLEKSILENPLFSELDDNKLIDLEEYKKPRIFEVSVESRKKRSITRDVIIPKEQADDMVVDIKEHDIRDVQKGEVEQTQELDKFKKVKVLIKELDVAEDEDDDDDPIREARCEILVPIDAFEVEKDASSNEHKVPNDSVIVECLIKQHGIQGDVFVNARLEQKTDVLMKELDEVSLLIWERMGGKFERMKADIKLIYKRGYKESIEKHIFVKSNPIQRYPEEQKRGLINLSYQLDDIGQLYLRLGEYEKALEYLLKAFRIQPDIDEIVRMAIKCILKRPFKTKLATEDFLRNYKTLFRQEADSQDLSDAFHECLLNNFLDLEDEYLIEFQNRLVKFSKWYKGILIDTYGKKYLESENLPKILLNYLHPANQEIINFFIIEFVKFLRKMKAIEEFAMTPLREDKDKKQDEPHKNLSLLGLFRKYVHLYRKFAENSDHKHLLKEFDRFRDALPREYFDHLMETVEG